MSSPILYFRFNSKDRLWIEGKPYRPVEREEEGHLLLREDDLETQRLFSNEELDKLVLAGEVRIERSAFRPEVMRARAKAEAHRINDLPERERSEVARREIYCTRFLEMARAGEATRSDKSMSRAIAIIEGEINEAQWAAAAKLGKDGDLIRPRVDKEIKTHKPPSPKTLRRSLKIFEGAEGQALALRKAYRRCGDRLTSRHPPEVCDLADDVAASFKEEAAEGRGSVRTLHAQLGAKLLVINTKRKAVGLPEYKTPSYHYLLSRVKELHALETLASRYGLDVAEAKMAAVARGAMATRPLERVEIDEWKIDLYTVFEHHGLLDDLTAEEIAELKKPRFWLCAVIDAATRVILGMKIGKRVGVQLALDTVEMAVSPKVAYSRIAPSVSRWLFCGPFEQIVHDQAKWFMSLAFRTPILDLGSEVLAPPAGKPRMRPKIERFFRTAKEALAFFTGRTFENVIVKGDYDPVGRASLTVPELCEVLVRWTVDQYHNSSHRGLNKQTPARAWESLTKKYGVMLPPHSHDLRAIFGVIVKNISISPSGVEFCGLFYNCLELQEFFQRRGSAVVDIKVNHRDINCISVELGDNCWLAVPCMRPGMEHVPLDVWLATRQALRRQHEDEAKLDDAIVKESILKMMEIAKAAEQRTALVTTRPTTEQLTQLHRDANSSFEFLRPDTGPTPLKGNLLAAAIIPARKTLPAPSSSTRKPSRTIK
ncbi:DDE-type integrase/transposase/recombinase [Bosea sp. F3-2]|uniref:DDE-type integrase/transposase/recombinase n=1 Tax=Bosea sp. F3-2 TaxID=2599640 RepID=UPI0011EBBB8D|nr:DDE-type integrase/transposase/recombinase [Bosea sp. F3-2]QEL22929.1 DDE-type integrase/transposase/recombinase [Bosea sp. F3-2]